MKQVTYGFIDFRPSRISYLIVPKSKTKTEKYVKKIMEKYEDSINNMTAIKTIVDTEMERKNVKLIMSLKIVFFSLGFWFPMLQCIFVKSLSVDEYMMYLGIATLTMLVVMIDEGSQIEARGWKYFMSKWNVLDIIFLLLFFSYSMYFIVLYRYIAPNSYDDYHVVHISDFFEKHSKCLNNFKDCPGETHEDLTKDAMNFILGMTSFH